MDKKYTMQEIADYYNEHFDIFKLEKMIEDSGFVSDCGEAWRICHNDTEEVLINDDGQAFVSIKF